MRDRSRQEDVVCRIPVLVRGCERSRFCDVFFLGHGHGVIVRIWDASNAGGDDVGLTPGDDAAAGDAFEPVPGDEACHSADGELHVSVDAEPGDIGTLRQAVDIDRHRARRIGVAGDSDGTGSGGDGFVAEQDDDALRRLHLRRAGQGERERLRRDRRRVGREAADTGREREGEPVGDEGGRVGMRDLQFQPVESCRPIARHVRIGDGRQGKSHRAVVPLREQSQGVDGAHVVRQPRGHVGTGEVASLDNDHVAELGCGLGERRRRCQCGIDEGLEAGQDRCRPRDHGGPAIRCAPAQHGQRRGDLARTLDEQHTDLITRREAIF